QLVIDHTARRSSDLPRWLRKATSNAVGPVEAAYDGNPIGSCAVPGLDWDNLVRRHRRSIRPAEGGSGTAWWPSWEQLCAAWRLRSEEHTSELQSREN